MILFISNNFKYRWNFRNFKITVFSRMRFLERIKIILESSERVILTDCFETNELGVAVKSGTNALQLSESQIELSINEPTECEQCSKQRSQRCCVALLTLSERQHSVSQLAYHPSVHQRLFGQRCCFSMSIWQSVAY